MNCFHCFTECLWFHGVLLNLQRKHLDSGLMRKLKFFGKFQIGAYWIFTLVRQLCCSLKCRWMKTPFGKTPGQRSRADAGRHCLCGCSSAETEKHLENVWGFATPKCGTCVHMFEGNKQDFLKGKDDFAFVLNELLASYSKHKWIVNACYLVDSKVNEVFFFFFERMKGEYWIEKVEDI